MAPIHVPREASAGYTEHDKDIHIITSSREDSAFAIDGPSAILYTLHVKTRNSLMRAVVLDTETNLRGTIMDPFGTNKSTDHSSSCLARIAG